MSLLLRHFTSSRAGSHRLPGSSPRGKGTQNGEYFQSKEEGGVS
jgi:hypothetical protein